MQKDIVCQCVIQALVWTSLTATRPSHRRQMIDGNSNTHLCGTSRSHCSAVRLDGRDDCRMTKIAPPVGLEDKITKKRDVNKSVQHIGRRVAGPAKLSGQKMRANKKYFFVCLLRPVSSLQGPVGRMNPKPATTYSSEAANLFNVLCPGRIGRARL